MKSKADEKRSALDHHGAPGSLLADLRVMAATGKLKGLRSVRYDFVTDWLDSGLSAEETCRKLSVFNRAVILAVLEAHEGAYPWLSNCTFLEFGSGGRSEQVLGSDQDNGLLVSGEVDEDELEDAANDIVIALDGAGLPLCTGGVMVSNEEWRGGFDAWLERMTGWLSNPHEKGPWQSGLMLDFEPVYGPEAGAHRLRSHLWEYVRSKPVVIKMLVDELTDYRMPLSLFGSFITEKKGQWEGHLNIKNSVLAHLTNAARILALKYDMPFTHTCDRVRAFTEAGHCSEKHGDALLRAWEWLQGRRLAIGIRCHEENKEPHNYVAPADLSAEERAELKKSIQAVEKLVRLVQAGAGL